MIKYPSIDQFRQIIREVKTRHDYQGKDENGDPIFIHKGPYPTLEFKGTVKIHGTNASIVKYKGESGYKFQSRERELSLAHDNSTFMLTMLGCDLEPLFSGIHFQETIVFYGEWCGGNIQKGVAINGLPKMFVIFGCKVDGKWCDFGVVPHMNYQNIYFIDQFKTWFIDVDFNEPEKVQNKFIELTEQVEAQCPVGKYFGVEGIGEGIVWKSTIHPTLMFKVKGEKHSVSKVTKLAAVDTVLIDSMKEFINLALTENRLNQGIEKLTEMGKPIDQKSTGDFLRWVIGDVIKEEQDTIIKNQFDPKKLNPLVSSVAKNWYFEYLNKIAISSRAISR